MFWYIDNMKKFILLIALLASSIAASATVVLEPGHSDEPVHGDGYEHEEPESEEENGGLWPLLIITVVVGGTMAYLFSDMKKKEQR